MKSNLFGKLSAGVAGVAGATLVAIGVVSTPVQAATIGIKFFDRSTFAGRGSLDSGYPAFDGSFVWNTNAAANNSISNWKLDIYRPGGTGSSRVTSSSYDKDTLTLIVNAKITSNGFATQSFPDINVTAPEQLIFSFENISKDGQPVIYPPSSWQGQVPYIDTLPRGSSKVLQADNRTVKWDDVRYTVVPEPSTYVGTILAFGALGGAKILKRKQKKQETFTP